MKNTIFKTVLFSLVMTSSSLADAQDQSKSILDRLSNKAKSYSSMEVEFEYILQNDADGINETQEGSLITKGENYRVSIAGQLILSNGKLVWTVLEDAEEVQINEVPSSEEEGEEYINPVKILTLWEKGFKYKYDQKLTEGGKSLDVINLFPEKPDDKSYHTVKLYVNQNELLVEKIIIKGKDGTNFTYVIKTFVPNKVSNMGLFSFDEKKHPDYEVIDLR